MAMKANYKRPTILSKGKASLVERSCLGFGLSPRFPGAALENLTRPCAETRVFAPLHVGGGGGVKICRRWDYQGVFNVANQDTCSGSSTVDVRFSTEYMQASWQSVHHMKVAFKSKQSETFLEMMRLNALYYGKESIILILMLLLRGNRSPCLVNLALAHRNITVSASLPFFLFGVFMKICNLLGKFLRLNHQLASSLKTF